MQPIPATDRELQDEIIRALADAPFRTSGRWQQLGLADPGKVERFARFLARHFYFERIVHFYKYSRALAPVTGRRPEEVLSSARFEQIFPRLVLGSRDSARLVAELVKEHVSGTDADIPYLRDLLRYEEAMMVAEAGPRLWRDPPREAAEDVGVGVRVSEGVQLLDLQFDITRVLVPLLGSPSEVPEAPMTPVRLLVARSERGRVIVAQTTPALEALVALADGKRTFREILEGSGAEESELRQALDALSEWGIAVYHA